MKTNFILTVLLISFCVTCQKGSNSGNAQSRVQNLESFARLYGYARWFHPSDEAQEIDWEKFAVLGIKKVENIRTTAELRDTLFSLFSPIVQGLQIYETQKPEGFDSKVLLSPDPNAKPVAWQHYGVYLKGDPNIYESRRTYKSETEKVMFDRIPQFGEIIKEPIGSNLTCVLPLTLLTNDTSTYPQTDRSKLALLQSELESIHLNEPQVNMASVIITWNVLQHFFPYFDVIETDWNKVLVETIDSTLTNKRKIDFFVTLNQMIAKLDDGHGLVLGEAIYSLPIKTEFVENSIVITFSKDSRLERGDIILKIDDKPVMEALNEQEKRISGSPQLRRYRALNILGSKLTLENAFKFNIYTNDNRESKLGSGVETRLLIERDNKEQTIVVTNTEQEGILHNMVNEGKYSSKTIVEIEPGIYYINMANCTVNEFEQQKTKLANSKAVIYDRRGGGDLILFQAIPYLIKEPVTTAQWNVPLTVYPDRKEVEFHKSNWNIQPKKPFFKSKSILINDPSIVSYGEVLTDIIDHYNLAITVGKQTAGCNGNANCINLPCGYQVMWTGMKVMKHDGSQLYLKGFEPDYPVSKTLQAVREGRDEYLEKALEVAR